MCVILLTATASVTGNSTKITDYPKKDTEAVLQELGQSSIVLGLMVEEYLLILFLTTGRSLGFLGLILDYVLFFGQSLMIKNPNTEIVLEERLETSHT